MKTLCRVLALAMLFTFTADCFAASDGTVGATSTGTSDITLTIPEYVIVRNMNDFALGSWNGTGAIDSNDDINIAGNDDQGTPSYQVTLSGSGAASAFTIVRTAPAAGPTIAYTVAFNDVTGTAGGVAATATTPITAQTGIHQVLTTVTTNANIRVQITLANLQAAPRGSYSGTLTIVVAPE